MEIIDSRKFQVSFRVLAAILLPIVFFMDIYGYFFLYSAIVDFNYVSAILGASALLGTIGYLAAWYRATKTQASMSSKQVGFVRAGLVLGNISALSLLGLSISSKFFPFIILCLLISIGGILFIYGTPKNI